jgi:hypothetical protein
MKLVGFKTFEAAMDRSPRVGMLADGTFVGVGDENTSGDARLYGARGTTAWRSETVLARAQPVEPGAIDRMAATIRASKRQKRLAAAFEKSADAGAQAEGRAMTTADLIKRLRAAGMKPFDYSGRGMMGERCLAVQGGASALEGLDVPSPIIDSLGKDVVFYWPGRPVAVVRGVCRALTLPAVTLSKRQKRLSAAFENADAAPETIAASVEKAVLAALSAHGLEPHEDASSLFVVRRNGFECELYFEGNIARLIRV